MKTDTSATPGVVVSELKSFPYFGGEAVLFFFRIGETKKISVSALYVKVFC